MADNIFGVGGVGGGLSALTGGYGGGGGFQPNANIGYQWGGPTNVGYTAYGGYSPGQATNAYTGGPGWGGAGTYAFNPAISGPPSPWQAPVYTNTMSNWNPYGTANASALSNLTDYYAGSGDTGQRGGTVSPSSFDQYSLMGGGGGIYSPMGTAMANAASYPNPNVNLYSPSNLRSSILSGIYGNEYASWSPSAQTNPYQMTGGLMKTVGLGNQPASNPAQSEEGAGRAVDMYGSSPYNYRYPGQIATAYNQGPGNVNPNYDPNVAGSTPYLSNVARGTNVTPQAYLYGNPSSGYAGFYQNQNNAAVNQQFGQAAGAGQPTAAGYAGGRY